MRHYSLFLVLTCILLSLSSCEKNDYSSYPPTWKGFQFTCNDQVVNPRTGIFAGDVITLTALQDQKGHLINGTTYNWDVIVPVLQEDGLIYKNDTIFSKSIHTNYDGTDNGDPSIKFTIPTNALGQSVVIFSAIYSYSGNGIQVADGGTYDSSGNVSGNITSTSAALTGGSKGSVRFVVNQR